MRITVFGKLKPVPQRSPERGQPRYEDLESRSDKAVILLIDLVTVNTLGGLYFAPAAAATAAATSTRKTV